MAQADKKTLRKVIETIARYAMIHPGDRVIVGVSGGPDSVCLLDILHRLKEELSTDLVVAHYEHGLRPEEDPGETEFVRQLANGLHYPFETEKGSPPRPGTPFGQEEALRNARYDFLERTRTKHGAHKIALGHNLEDQAETILMRLLRGSGSAGLAGIPPVRNTTIIRPLIQLDRREIETYLESRRLKHVVDSSNLRAIYLRNRIRLELIPILKKYQPQVIKRLAEAAVILRREDEFLEGLAEDWVAKEATREPDGSLSVPISSFLSAPAALRNRVTRLLIRRIKTDLRRIGRKHIEAVFDLGRGTRPQTVLHFPDPLCVERIYDRLVFRRAQDRSRRRNEFYYEIPGAGRFPLERIGKVFSIQEVDRKADFLSEPSPWTVHLDRDKIEYPLVVRNVKPGDRFVPLGMKGHKKIKDFFVDLKVPLVTRRLAPLLLSGDTPVWVGGFRLDDRFKVTDDTKKVLRVSLSPLLAPEGNQTETIHNP